MLFWSFWIRIVQFDGTEQTYWWLDVTWTDTREQWTWEMTEDTEDHLFVFRVWWWWWVLLSRLTYVFWALEKCRVYIWYELDGTSCLALRSWPGMESDIICLVILVWLSFCKYLLTFFAFCRNCGHVVQCHVLRPLVMCEWLMSGDKSPPSDTYMVAMGNQIIFYWRSQNSWKSF